MEDLNKILYIYKVKVHGKYFTHTHIRNTIYIYNTI